MPLRATSLVCIGVLLAAAEPLTGSTTIIASLRLVEYGCLAAFCWYGLTKALPRMQKDAQGEATRSREHYSEIIDKLVARMEADRRADRETLHEMIRHCSREREKT